MDKIGSYNLFNYLLPGSLYLGYLQISLPYDFSDENIVLVGFLAYFLGLVVSRIGSLIVEPFLKYIKFVQFKDYKEFVIASSKDVKLETLSEQNNTYRTIVALLLTIGGSILFKWVIDAFDFSNETTIFILILILVSLFLGAYRKQTKYITQRIERVIGDRTE